MLRNLLLTLGTRLLLGALGLASSILTARLLGPEARGRYFVALTLTAVAAQLATLGLHSSNSYLAGTGASLPRLAVNSLWISIAGGGTAALVAFGLLLPLDLLGGLDFGLTALSVLGVAPALFYMLASNALVGANLLPVFNRFELAARISPLLLIALVAGHAAPEVFLGANVLASMAVSWSLFRRLSPTGVASSGFDKALIRRGIGYGLRAYLASMLALGVARTNVFLLGSLRGPAEVGQYSIAAQIADLLSMLPASLSLVMFPELMRRSRDRWSVTVRALSWTLLTLGSVCGVAALLAKPLMPVFFGAAFRPATEVLLWSLPGVFFLGLASVLSQFLASLGIPRSLLVVWAAALTAQWFLGHLAIRLGGAPAAGATLSAAYLAVFLGLAAVAIRHRPQASLAASKAGA